MSDEGNNISGSLNEGDSDPNKSLELNENHFSCHSDLLSMDSAAEIESAIEACKQNILTLTETSEEKRLLVQKLVKLRLKLQEVKELEIYMDPKKMTIVQSHRFVTQSVLQLKFQSSQIYCETCCGVIWIPVQGCYYCSDCGYVSHGQCLNMVRRVCSSSKVAESPNLILEICPERSLESQSYKCAECKSGVSFDVSLSQPVLCDYTGEYYCKYCHWGNLSVIPARIVSNWDFTHYPVSQASKQFLRLMMKKPVINLEAVNPYLFGFVEELALIKRLRMDILIMKEYILTCKDALEAKLLRLLEDRQHFVENHDHYSIQDLIDVSSKELQSYLEPIHRQFVSHITQDCMGCRGKGHICRMCNQLPVIFPFENCVALCDVCHCVYHRNCLGRRDAVCIKCLTKARNHNK